MYLLALSVLVSVCCLLFLGFTDPKRKRSRGKPSRPGRFARPGISAFALMPGLWMLLQAEGSLFLIWLGIVSITGWVIALVLPKYV